jgi:hypothetical protein
MTEHEAIKLATQYQKDRHRNVKVSDVHRVGQDKMDALAECSGEARVTQWPDWMRPFAHWVVLFDRGLNIVPAHFVISVYDDGAVFETPAL